MQREDAIEWLRDNLTGWPSIRTPVSPPPPGWMWRADRVAAHYELERLGGTSPAVTEDDLLADGGTFLCGRYVRPGDRGQFKTASGYECEGVYAGQYGGRVWFADCTGVASDLVADLEHLKGWARLDPREKFVRLACNTMPAAAGLPVGPSLRAFAAALYDAGARFPDPEA